VSDTVRSFIAIPLTPGIKTAAGQIQNRLQSSLPNVRWANPDTMHLTLHFFGDIDEESLEKAGICMVSIGSLYSPFSLQFSGVGAFPSPNRARVFWLGGESETLVGLHRALTERLIDSGFAVERRPFRPHITLGRSRHGAQKARHILSSEQEIIAGEMTVDRLVLYESQLLPSGAVHRARQTTHFTAD
jgi:2'-5' RNA ligase